MSQASAVGSSAPLGRDDLYAEGAMGLPEASEFTGLGRSDLYERMQRGQLVYSKVGRRRLIPKRALIKLLTSGAVGEGQ